MSISSMCSIVLRHHKWRSVESNVIRWIVLMKKCFLCVVILLWSNIGHLQHSNHCKNYNQRTKMWWIRKHFMSPELCRIHSSIVKITNLWTACVWLVTVTEFLLCKLVEFYGSEEKWHFLFFALNRSENEGLFFFLLSVMLVEVKQAKSRLLLTIHPACPRHNKRIVRWKWMNSILCRRMFLLKFFIANSIETFVVQ